MKTTRIFILSLLILAVGCDKTDTEKEKKMDPTSEIAKRLAEFVEVEITADMSHLSDKQKQLVFKLVEAGQVADKIFWLQTSHDALATREAVAANSALDPVVKAYVELMYGPYDRIREGRRFIGEGPEFKPAGAGFYPEDLTVEAFESYIAKHPDQKEALTGQYSVVVYEDENLKTIPYHVFYADEVELLSAKLREAAELAENATLKAYLEARATAIATDDYYESDRRWMQIKDNDIDIVIGPIENYEDGLFNYRSAYEAAIMIKDPEGTRMLNKYISHLDKMESILPQKPEYRRASAGKGNILEIVNIAYFGGDFQAGIKTIAASLPNDPRIHEEFGAKKQMYKNLIDAKFDKILVPIAKVLLAETLAAKVSREAFSDFITLHEVSHTLGRGYVFGNDELTVRQALKEHYSAIEEAKADILAIHWVPYLTDYDVYLKGSEEARMVTYLAGLFRSVRFGAEEAHGKSNICQFNFLQEQGALARHSGRYTVDPDKFFPAVKRFAEIILNIQAEGDYEGATKFLDKYGHMSDELKRDLKQLEALPRDLNTTYPILSELAQ
jgi:hypothetical protein